MAGLLPHLGKVCRDARTRARVRQLDVAERAGITHSSVSRFEHGRLWPRNPDVLVGAYARELDLPPAELWMIALETWLRSEP